MKEDGAAFQGLSDEILQASGKVTEAFEWIERARGRLYDFHQMIGRADMLLGEAADMLEKVDAGPHAQSLRSEIIGRNVLDGRWTYQVVEEFDDCYYAPVAAAEAKIRHELVGGERHVHEAQMKERRRSKGVHGHEARPPRRPSVDI